MAQAERIDVDADPTLITTYGLGSVLSGGGSTPASNTPEAWADMVDGYQEAALETRLGIPLLYGVDSVHGHGNLRGATVFPHNIGLGATRDPALVEEIAHITAKETRASGPQWAFAPCVCVARDDRWGRTYESFGEDPRLVTRMETAIDGLQGRTPADLKKPDRVLASAKHFAGDGLTAYGTGEGDYTVDQGIDEVSRAEFDELALAPFRPAVRKHHVGSVMPSFSSVDWTEDGLGNPVKMHANEELLTGWLKEQQGFDGIVISDWRAIRQLPGDVRRPGARVGQRRRGHVHGADPGAEQPRRLGRLHPDADRPRRLRRGADEPHRRRGHPDPHREVRPRPVREAVHRPPLHRHHRQQGAPQGRAPGGGAVAGAAQERRPHAAAEREATQPVYVAGSNADNIGNQAGGWTHHLAGRLDQRDPGRDRPGRGARPPRTRGSSSARRPPTRSRPTPRASSWSARRRTPRASATSNGPQWGYDPGDGGVLRPKKTMQLSEADQRRSARSARGRRPARCWSSPAGR